MVVVVSFAIVLELSFGFGHNWTTTRRVRVFVLRLNAMRCTKHLQELCCRSFREFLREHIRICAHTRTCMQWMCVYSLDYAAMFG